MVAWIIVTLMLALVVGLIAWGTSEEKDFFSFLIGFAVVCQVSLAIGFIYVAGHFIQKYW